MPRSEACPSTDPATVVVAAGRPDPRPGSPLNAPITPATALVPGDGPDYSRQGHPAWRPFEQALGLLEGGRALAFGSGMAASTAAFDLVPLGATVAATEHAYSGTLDQLQQRDAAGLIELRLVDVTDTAAVLEAAAGAAMLWLESPTNPLLELADIESITAKVDEQTIVAVDNTFATPLRQRPLELGADLVVHSASKVIAGHSDALIGVAVTADETIYSTLERRRTSTGGTPGALECWLALRGLRTLAVRLDRAEANAQELSARLATLDAVSDVRYPGWGFVVSFTVPAGADAAQRATERSALISYATSLGGVESTWERRRRHRLEPLAVPENLIRLSVGIEAVEDLWADLCAALSEPPAPSDER